MLNMDWVNKQLLLFGGRPAFKAKTKANDSHTQEAWGSCTIQNVSWKWMANQKKHRISNTQLRSDTPCLE